jgi:hypothetical protein
MLKSIIKKEILHNLTNYKNHFLKTCGSIPYFIIFS